MKAGLSAVEKKKIYWPCPDFRGAKRYFSSPQNLRQCRFVYNLHKL
jgi:hypothetical protein